MSTKHSPGRIYFRVGGEANNYTLIDQTTNNWRMTLLLNGEQVTARQAADLERMAACWNACEGISTESLEHKTVIDSVGRVSEIQKKWRKGRQELANLNRAHGNLIAHRDELLEALRIARDHIDMDALEISHCKDAALIRAAIAKALGSAT